MISLNIYQPKKNTKLFLRISGHVWSFSFGIYSWKYSLPASLGSWDQGWYNTSKFFRPFPLSTFAYDFIFHIWNLSWFMVQYTWKFEIFSFIGTKIVKKGAGILTGLAEIITKAIKGLNFLHLWGEEGTHWDWDQYHWLTIQYLCMLSETSAQIHKYWLRELMKGEQMVLRWECSAQEGVDALPNSTPPVP